MDLDFLSADLRLVNVGEDSARGKDSSSLRSIVSLHKTEIEIAVRKVRI